MRARKRLERRQIEARSWGFEHWYATCCDDCRLVFRRWSMRGFLVAFVVVVFSALGFGQAGSRGIPEYCPYGCGPYVPLVTTPIIEFETVSSSPVGASNATGGLYAGARNATLSLTTRNTDAVHTEVVWESGGGSPAVSPAVWLPRPGPMGMHEGHMERMEHGAREEGHAVWIYTGLAESASAVKASVAAKGGKHAVRTYTNEDINRVAAKSEPFRKN